jgi:peptide chain release factor 3
MNPEIERRRTFAIISHPDAGKTTLTEKFLLFGGQIQVAGAVKSNKIRKTATSDWMDIEKQRGISVTTSVMEFDYLPDHTQPIPKGGESQTGGNIASNGSESPSPGEGVGVDSPYKVNILDTPGHQDFAEDTFRTLTAVDSAIIVVDGAKGVEAQTRKLMTVCRMRKTPVIVFVNKMDREGKDPFDLLDELEEELQIKVRPLSWPINQGARFKGVYNIYEQNLNLFTPDKQRVTEKVSVRLDSDELEAYVGDDDAAQLREDLEIIEGVYPEFDRQTYLDAEVAPVFFGSALNNFGVKELLDCFVEIAPSPRPVKAEEREVEPEEAKFTGFIFKITANIDPNHRSCIAFCKVCSGKFVRNAPYLHVRQGKTVRFSSPTQFMAQRKSTIDEAWPGDIVGLPDNGIFKIGDTLTEGEQLHFRGLPSFSPEMFKYIENADPMKTKQLEKGIAQLMDEGVAQLFVNQFNGRKIIGTVGQLQFEVIQYRLENEYNAKCRWEPVSLYKACWIESDDEAQLEAFKKRKYQYMARDIEGRDVFLADSNYVLQMAQQDFEHIRFHFTSEF